jgi:hypothetical protein
MHYTANGNFVNDQVRENFKTIKNRKNIERFEDVSGEAGSGEARPAASVEASTVNEVAKLIASALAPENTASREPDLTNEQTYEYGGKIYIVGRQGPKGDQGAIGLTGPQGNPGVKGDQGEIGGQGIKGDQGPAGAAGQPGIKGDKGDQGVQGPQGIPGNKGDQGPMGPTGPPFDTTLIQSEICQFYNNLAGQLPDKALYQPNFCLKLSTGNTGPLINSVPAPVAPVSTPAQSVESVGGAVSDVSSQSAPYASEGFRNINREGFYNTRSGEIDTRVPTVPCPRGHHARLHMNPDGKENFKCFRDPVPLTPCPDKYSLATKTAVAGYCMPIKKDTIASVQGPNPCPNPNFPTLGPDGSACHPPETFRNGEDGEIVEGFGIPSASQSRDAKKAGYKTFDPTIGYTSCFSDGRTARKWYGNPVIGSCWYKSK